MAAQDKYAGIGSDLLGPSSNGEAVTPHDTTQLTYASKRLYIGAGGDVTLITVEGTTLSYSNVPTGTYLNVRAKQVKSSGTTATRIVAEH